MIGCDLASARLPPFLFPRLIDGWMQEKPPVTENEGQFSRKYVNTALESTQKESGFLSAETRY